MIKLDNDKYLTDFGSYVVGSSDDSVSPAKEALVFMVNSVNSNWKLPIGFFFIAGLNSRGR